MNYITFRTIIMAHQAFLVLFLLVITYTTHAQCNPKEYKRIFAEAAALQGKGAFIEAKNTYEAAKVYACDNGVAADAAVDKLFALIEQLRQEAQAARDTTEVEKTKAQNNALATYANDLAYKSKIALRDGDRNTAFRLAEFAYRFVDANNPQITRALVDGLYYNDNYNLTPLPRVGNLEGHLGSIKYAAFSPNGSLLATASSDETVLIWDFYSKQIIKKLEGHTQSVRFVSFLPDGKRVVTASLDSTIRIWDYEEEKSLVILKGNSGYDKISISPNGTQLATTSYEDSIRVWDLKSGKPLMAFKDDGVNYITNLNYITFSPNGEKLAVASSDNKVAIWDLKTGRGVQTILGYFYSVECLAFSPNGKNLAIGERERPLNNYSVKIYDLESGSVLLSQDHLSSATYSIAFSPDGNFLAIGGYKLAHICNIKNGEIIFSLVGHTSRISFAIFSPDGKTLVTCSYDGIAKIWDLKMEVAALNHQEGNNGRVDDISFTPNKKQLAIACDNIVDFWEFESNKVVTTFEGHNASVNSIDISKDGKYLATGSGSIMRNDNKTKVWDIATGNIIFTTNEQNSWVECVAFSPNGNLLATTLYNGISKVWDWKNDSIVMSFEGQLVSFSPDGSKFACSMYESVNVWDIQSKAIIQSFSDHDSRVSSLTFSPNGKLLAVGTFFGVIKFWDLENGKFTSFDAHTSSINSLAFSPDASCLATGAGNALADDNTAKIWDLKSTISTHTLKGQSIPVQSIAFSPDGKMLGTGSGDFLKNNNYAEIWEVSADGLIRRWRETGPQAALTLPQLQQYSLEALLTLHPDNETKLIATRETWQIKAFADLAASQAAGSNILARVEPHYARAERLYAAALDLQDELLIRMDYAKMLRSWAAVYRSDGLEGKAGALEAKADGLWKE